jgi:hypothetical protein
MIHTLNKPPPMQTLLSTANAKLQKGSKKGFTTYGLSLAPYNLSGKNLCPHASEGCAIACLNTAGMGVFSNVQEARIAKAKEFVNNREAFLATLKKEIASKVKSAKKKMEKIAFRLNVLSDLPWHNLVEMSENKDIPFYDYTPNPKRMIQFLNGELPANYHLTFSRKENNQAQCELILAMGGNVAVVFDKLPQTYLGKPVVDGDETDLRFLDPKGVVIGLKAKGKAKKDTSGFVVKISDIDKK